MTDHARRLPATLAAWVFILVGAGGILKDVLPLAAGGRSALDALGHGWPMLSFIWFVRALAITGGVGVLRGARWAGWVLVGWMVFHVGLSLAHSVPQAVVHVAIFAVLSWALFGGRAIPRRA